MPDSIEEQWDIHTREVKSQVWDVEPFTPGQSNPDFFYTLKFTSLGEVREGFDYHRYLDWYWEYVPKIGTKDCYTAAHRYGWK